MEIQQAEKDTSRSYTCTFCQEVKDEMRTNKISKTVESDTATNNKNIRNSNPQMMLCSNNSLAIAFEIDPIRDEEALEPSNDIYDVCCACDTDIIDDRLTEICEICNNIAHTKCIVEEHESKFCLPCKSTLDMLETKTNETNLKTNQENIEVIIIEPNVEETTPKNTSLEHRIEKTIPLIANRDDINHQSNNDQLNQQNSNSIPRLKANKTHFDPADQETLRIKLSELREKEIKLKKTEDQLKVREKIINDEKQKRIQLETRCQNLEARNYELEALVRTMKKRLDDPNDQNETLNSEKPGNPDVASKMREKINTKILAMHEKLTDIVFDQIDTQLNMMAQNLSENSTSVASARIVRPPNEKVTNSGIQSENWQEMETPNNGEHTKCGTTPTFTYSEATPRLYTTNRPTQLVGHPLIYSNNISTSTRQHQRNTLNRPQPPYSNQQIGLTLETPRKTLYSGNTQHSYHQSNREHERWKQELGTRRHVTVKDRQQHNAHIMRNTSSNQNGTSQRVQNYEQQQNKIHNTHFCPT